MRATTLTVRALALGAAAMLLVLAPGCTKDSNSSTGAGSVITVTGTVIDDLGRPIANTPVIVSGRPATTTDANGVFTVTEVTTPYDVTAVYSAFKMAIVYKGITRTDPAIYFTGAAVSPPNSATVSGALSGGAGYPLPASHANRVVFVATGVSGWNSPNTTTGTYSMGVNWAGANTITGILHGLQYQVNASGMATDYKGYGTKTNVTLTSGGTFASQNLSLSSVTASTVGGTIVVPAGMSLSSKSLRIGFNDAGDVLIAGETTSATSFTYAVPEIPGIAVVLAADASGAAGTTTRVVRTTVGASGLTVTLIAPPQHSLPVASATGVTTTTPFTWTPVTGGVYIVYFNGAGADPDLYVVTTSATATIPDLTAQGLGLPTNKAYTWQVLSFGPFASMDEATGGRGVIAVVTNGWQARSTSRGFTTAP